MKYLKKILDEKALDSMRINLSVHIEKLSPDVVCDFCGDTHPRVVFAASRMSTGLYRECWRWTACATCENLVEAGNFLAVEDRIAARLKQMWKDRNLPKTTDLAIREAVKKSLFDFYSYSIKISEEKS